MIDYKTFDDHLEKIFVERELEKAPTKKWKEFKAPSILDPLDVLDTQEEGVLERCLIRIGIETKNRRLLIKPYFQDKVSPHNLTCSRIRVTADSWQPPDSDRSLTS